VVFKRVVAEPLGENEPTLAQAPAEEAVEAPSEPEGAAEPPLEVGQAIGAPDEREATPEVVIVEPEVPVVEANEAHVEVVPRRSPRFASAHAIYTTLSATFMTGDSDAVIDPLTYKQAMESPEAVYWQKAMDSELASVMRAGTWVEASTPQGRKLVGCRWVYKTKRDASGGIAKYKARIVAQGYSQIEGVDYDETFSPVARLTSLRLLMAVVASKGLRLHQMDADTAFLNGKLDEEVYMALPPGYQNSVEGTTCVKLVKSLYGLKQSPRVWWKLVSCYFQSLGFKRVDSDWGLYYSKEKEAHLLLYVDDVLITAPSMEAVNWLKDALKEKWSWTDLGEAAYVLGLRIDRDAGAKMIKLSQLGYIDRVLARFGLTGALTVTTPLEQGHMEPCSKDEAVDPARQKFYMSIIGSLMWVAQSLRPDVAFAVGYLSRFSTNPSEQHLRAAKRVWRYLKGSRGAGLTLGGFQKDSLGEEGMLVGYCDADYAGCMTTRKSTTGYVFTYNRSVISWASNRQPTVATSTTEAEYMALSDALKEGIWLSRMLSDLGIPTAQFIIYCDNKAAIALTANPGKHKHSKHIDVRYHFIRERVIDDTVVIRHVGTNDQAADMLTKALIPIKHTRNCALIKLE
jgi:hypothetical protein